MFKYLVPLLILLQVSCSDQDCDKLPTFFPTYAEAKLQISKTRFAFFDTINTAESSWIRGAHYFSCDKKVGFMIFKTDTKEYIHQNLPIEIWNGFKLAGSFGAY